MKKFLKALLLAVALVCLAPMAEYPAGVTAYAKADSGYYVITKSNVMLFRNEKGKIKVPAAFKKPTFKSSNKKVATVSSTGVVTAKAKGTTTITMKYKKKVKKYKITVNLHEKEDYSESDGGELNLNGSETECFDEKYVLVEVPASFKDPTFKSSNEKVLMVNSRGFVTPVRLGTATVEVKYKNKTRKYNFTVTGGGGFYLKQSMLFNGQKAQLEVACANNEFDLSQIEWKVRENDLNVSESGYFGGFTDAMKAADDGRHDTTDSYWLDFYYGNDDFEYEVPLKFCVLSEDLLVLSFSTCEGLIAEGDEATVYLPKIARQGSESYEADGEQRMKVSVDGTPITGGDMYLQAFRFEATYGTHTVTAELDGYQVKKQIFVAYSPVNAAKHRDTTGYPEGKLKELIEKAIQIISDPGVIRSGMSGREKVKAVHDYIILHAEYSMTGYSPDDGVTSEVESAYGILCKGRGVCCAYASAFAFLMEVLDIPCKGVHSSQMNHAWNQVQVDGKWYYIDCTWDDRADGVLPEEGSTAYKACYDYFLGETLWGDHNYADVGPGGLGDLLPTY